MILKYNLDWLFEQWNNKQVDGYIFFWKPTPSDNQEITASCFSQWWLGYPFTVDRIKYLTTEHWMMAKKAELFGDSQRLKEILEETQPAKVQILARAVKKFNKEIWERESYKIVLDGNYHKFSQNSALRDFLFSTGNKILVEASPQDRIWGVGLLENALEIENPYTWKGTNLLGFALMEVRDKLKSNGLESSRTKNR